MAGFFRGLAIIGAIALYSPVNLQGETPSWTESAGSAPRATAETTRNRLDATPVEKAVTNAATGLALDAGKALASRFAELDPETRRLMLDMSLSAAARIAADQTSRLQGDSARR